MNRSFHLSIHRNYQDNQWQDRLLVKEEDLEDIKLISLAMEENRKCKCNIKITND